MGWGGGGGTQFNLKQVKFKGLAGRGSLCFTESASFLCSNSDFFHVQITD